MLADDVLGVTIPDAGPVFATALAIHIGAGLTCVITGALAATARKRPGRHPAAGRVYLWGLAVVFATATVLSVKRWRQDAHLFAIGLVAFTLGLFGWQMRRRRPAGWPRWHAIGMGGSYIALLTAFYVDNGPQLPLWKLLPTWAFWILPTVIGVPLIRSALRRYRRGVSTQPRRPAGRTGAGTLSS
ncbi:hypothetical protein HDA40_001785 [Hamadaea flava]|uniref:DUF2306 domain-containing protein n=2 Tax=Hamadaea flava TaxID=1742688 RepID=A0ABV8LP51_9ACTN|nr:hypothetical protein [Hamadaea flava]